MSKYRGRTVAGYMTVEATVVFMTAVSVIVFVIFCGLYKYERCTLELDTYYDVQRSLQLGQALPEDVKIDMYKASAQREREQLFWIGLQETANLTIHVQAEIKQLKPAYVMRLSQRLKRMKDER